jgi:hypothetical protein
LRTLVGSRVKASPEAISGALTGRPGPHHRFLLGLHLGQINAIAAATATIDAEVDHDLGPSVKRGRSSSPSLASPRSRLRSSSRRSAST